MIKYIEFENFRNLNKKYDFSDKLNVIVGKNNTGKSNLLDGIKLAFSLVNNDYFKISKSDFNNSDDSKNIIIKVELDKNFIPTLNHFDENGNEVCGFGRYIKQINYLNGGFIDLEILREDSKIPNVYTIPLIRIEDIYSEGLTVGLSKFINSEEDYKEIISNSKISIKKE